VALLAAKGEIEVEPPQHEQGSLGVWALWATGFYLVGVVLAVLGTDQFVDNSVAALATVSLLRGACCAVPAVLCLLCCACCAAPALPVGLPGDVPAAGVPAAGVMVVWW